MLPHINPSEVSRNPGTQKPHYSPRHKWPLRIALLTNFIPPYLLPVLQEVAMMVSEFKIFLSTDMERERSWPVVWTGLNVQLQKTFTLVRARNHALGFTSQSYIHLPYDTVPMLQKFKPDVVISAQFGFRTIQAGLFRMWRPETGLVVWADLSEHTETGVGPGRQMLRRLLAHCSDAILVNGTSGSRYVTGLRFSQQRIVAMPYVRNMRDLRSIPLHREGQAERRLLYVGQLTEGKGVHLLLHALDRWSRLHPDDEYELCIAGDGPMRAYLESFAKEKALRVTFAGSIPFQNLRAVYSSAGIFVFPTLSDTWGVVVNEALAAGLPVLGSELSQAVAELIIEGRNGWKFRPERPAEFDAQLNKALATKAENLEYMREAARSSVETLTPRYAAEQMMKAARLAYSSAMDRLRNRGGHEDCGKRNLQGEREI
jgi:glycosyltransferase involved in cell wall biosynthesis